MASDFLPPGRLILAASQTNARDAAHAASRAFWILKCHVSLPDLDEGFFTSSAERITTVLSLLRAAASRDACDGVSTSFSFSRDPEPTMIRSAGAVML